MAATSLAARCTACHTIFRVVPDQLRVSEGWVRCGRCSEVFNAAQNLVDMETGALRRPADESRGKAAAGLAPLSSPDPAPAAAAAAAADAPADAPERLPEQPAPAVDDGPAAAPPEDDPHADPADKPAFVRQAERAERWRRPGVRAMLAVLAVLGLAGLAGQVTHEYRDLVAARFPAARPLLERACASLGCTVEPAHAIDSLGVDSSGLVRVEKSSIYKLQVALRNRAGIDLALPALDLTLTDSQGRLIARKVLHPAELGAQQVTIGAGRELALQATLQAAGDASATPIAGYTIELFYP
jgi:predicted Zn finger-like uncharacterized protein